jgi:aspartyl aminopeptidase
MDQIQALFDFIESSPTACHTVETVRQMLLAQGFQELSEREGWQLEKGGKYFTTRAMSSLIAFQIPENDFSAFSIVAPHGDAPCFKVKGNPEMEVDGHYTKLNTEVYGGMQLNLWTDRPLSVAGRLVLRTEKGVEAKLVNLQAPLAIIPGLAIHLNRTVNQGFQPDPQKDTLPLLGSKGTDLLAMAAEAAGAKKEDILSHDLYLYNRQRGTVVGAEEEYIASPKLDDLECVFAAVTAFLQSENKKNVRVCAVFDNEEIGSLTRQGADSTFLSDVLSRICQNFGKTEEELRRAIAGGFMLSADNAHGVHPNYPEKADPTSRCYLNEGIVIKHSTRYATDSITDGVFRCICEKAGVPVQSFYNHSAVPGGSTLGNLSGSHVSIPTVDIGMAQLSMHSPYETAGAKDLAYMIQGMQAFYESVITCNGGNAYTITSGKEG